MKIAAKVFIIIALVYSAIATIFGFIILGIGMSAILTYVPASTAALYSNIPSWTFLATGLYSLVVCIGSLVAIQKTSKTAVIVWAIFLLPVTLLGAIFMFCIKSEDLLYQMKIAAKVLLLIGLVTCLIPIGYGIYFLVFVDLWTYPIARTYGYYCLGIAFYGIITSIGSLISLRGHSKLAVVIWGIFYLPVFLFASIIMFCIPKKDFHYY